MNPRERLKWRLLVERNYTCDALEFWPHACEGGLEMDERLFSRAHAMKSKKLQAYINDERNCTLLCSKAHRHLQHSRDFRRWWRDERATALFGSRAVADYIANWPEKPRGKLG